MGADNYILGVDGGNSKTDFALFRTDGALCSFLREGTCSHEKLGGYDLAGKAIASSLKRLLAPVGVSAGQIGSAVFGLAGVDIPEQRSGMERAVSGLGLRESLVCNDGLLGIKAASPRGVGVCSINGTGTVCVGVDETGAMLQVGGTGAVAGDNAGGAYLARRAIGQAYAQRFRNGPVFGGTQWIEEKLHITCMGKWLEAIHPTRLHYKSFMTELIQLLFHLEQQGDLAARAIVVEAAENLADGVIGCIRNLTFHHRVEVVMAGSVWSKGNCRRMKDTFMARVEACVPQEVAFTVLDSPPVLGAVYWAMERETHAWPEREVRERVRGQIQAQERGLR